MTPAGTVPDSTRPFWSVRRRVLLVLGIVVVLLLLAAAWVAVRTLLAKGELDEAVARADDAKAAVAEGDTDAAAIAVRRLATPC